MPLGVVNAAQEATLPLTVPVPGGQTQHVEALIDTGFSGFLTLPPARIASLGLTWLGRQQGTLADGRLLILDIYETTLLWDGQVRTVETQAVDAPPLLGMGLLDGNELRIAVKNGGAVSITALP